MQDIIKFVESEMSPVKDFPCLGIRDNVSDQKTLLITGEKASGLHELKELISKGEWKNKPQHIFTIYEDNEAIFEKRVNECLEQGYKILSTDCGFCNSEQYDFCNSWMAILIK